MPRPLIGTDFLFSVGCVCCRARSPSGSDCAMTLGPTLNGARVLNVWPFGGSKMTIIRRIKCLCVRGTRTCMPGKTAGWWSPWMRPNGGAELNWNTTTGVLVSDAWIDCANRSAPYRDLFGVGVSGNAFRKGWRRLAKGRRDARATGRLELEHRTGRMRTRKSTPCTFQAEFRGKSIHPPRCCLIRRQESIRLGWPRSLFAPPPQ